MSHHTQKQRNDRIETVRNWLRDQTVRQVINRSVNRFGCTREKAVEYIVEATRE